MPAEILLSTCEEMKDSCQKCGVVITCQQSTNCWCSTYPHILQAQSDKCLCADCLKSAILQRIDEMIEGQKFDQIKALGIPTHLIEDIDYYTNAEGLMVFTKWYHLRRGYCCDNNCLHCIKT